MNVSAYENHELVPCTANGGSAEAIGFVVSDLMVLLEHNQLVTYCPLCVSSFPDLVSLEGHLRVAHLAFLWELTSRSIRLDTCPLCPAKFVGHYLVAKHAITFHTAVLIDAFFEKHGSTVNCMFCHSAVITRNIQTHLEEWHALQFIEWFASKFQIRPNGVTGLVEKTTAARIDVDDLNEHLQNLKVMSSPKSILKKTPINKASKPPVRRGLSFDDENKENAIIKDIPASTAITNSSRSCTIECGKCGLNFASCKQLDFHIKKDHRKMPVNMLRRFYKCSLCGANFFKKSYLTKHTAQHSLSKFR